MVSSEEIIERSLYMRLLTIALNNNLTLDPDDYLPPSPETEKKYKEDMAKLNKYVYIFGVGNNQVKGAKYVPRIVLNLASYYPGHIGVEKFMVDDTDKTRPQVMDVGYTTKDVAIDVHLVANNSEDLRLLHSIMYKALPSMGYIAPYVGGSAKDYINQKVTSSNNIFLEVGNYYDHQDLEHGLLEKVYQYNITDGILDSFLSDMEVVPITNISTEIFQDDSTDNKSLVATVNVP